MVIRVVAEGGVAKQQNALPEDKKKVIAQNSAALREALNKFFKEAIGIDNLEIRIILGESWVKSTRKFLDTKNDADYLYVDLDRSPEKKSDWFRQFKSRPFPKDKEQFVFFWIQEMEAWFLKQPDSIEKWAAQEGYTLNKGESIAEDSSIKELDIEHLNKPSKVLKDIFHGHLFYLDKDSHPIPLSYGKLKHAPGIIECLDPKKMITQDMELDTFVRNVNTKSTTINQQ